MTQIVLATASLQRRRIFSSLGFNFICEASNIKEKVKNRPTNPKNLVKFLAKLKADKLKKKYPKAIIFGFDSIGYYNGNIFEKPKTKKEVKKRLIMLSGKTYQHFTGICAIRDNTYLYNINKTNILMRKLSMKEIYYYLNQKDKHNTHSEGYDHTKFYSASFIKKINGSYHSLNGIPLDIVIEMLKKLKYDKIK